MSDIVEQKSFNEDIEKVSSSIELDNTTSSSPEHVPQKKRNFLEMLWYGIENVETKGIAPVLEEEQNEDAFQ